MALRLLENVVKVTNLEVVKIVFRHLQLYLFTLQHNSTKLFNWISVTLLNITGNTYYSTATAVHVPINYGTTVACSSGQTDVESEIKRSILIIGKQKL